MKKSEKEHKGYNPDIRDVNDKSNVNYNNNATDKNSKKDVNNVWLNSENFSAPEGIWEGSVYGDMESKGHTEDPLLNSAMKEGYNPEYLRHNTKKEGLGPNTKR